MVPIRHNTNIPIGAKSATTSRAWRHGPFEGPSSYPQLCWWSLICVGLSFILLFISVNALACPLELPVATIDINGNLLEVELATTPEARVCGLSKRVKLPENRGMLFIYPTVGQRTFWMKDTRIPLSIAFLDDSGRILSIQHMAPMQTEERYHSLQPARYALEINQGWFTGHGIGVGDIVEMRLPVVIEIR
jgi:uncharacterized membrane protein (UPF0127 family)